MSSINKKNDQENKTVKANQKDLPIISFDTVDKWKNWLSKNHNKSKGIWIRFYKKGSDVVSVKYKETLMEALCYGWIDGQLDKYDDDSYLQKFTPRRAKSIWSKRNIEYVSQLQKEGRMKPAGLKEVETAKTDERWKKAYDSPGNMKIPDDFIKLISKNKKAYEFFKTLNKTNMYSIGWRLETAKKPETREKRIITIIEKLAKGEKFH